MAWVKLYRRLRKHFISRNPNLISIWVYLLLTANWDDYKDLKRGQLKTTRKTIEKETGIHPATVERCLMRLEKNKVIEQKTTNKYRIITIVNYDRYQGFDDETGQQNGQHFGQQVDIKTHSENGAEWTSNGHQSGQQNGHPIVIKKNIEKSNTSIKKDINKVTMEISENAHKISKVFERFKRVKFDTAEAVQAWLDAYPDIDHKTTLCEIESWAVSNKITRSPKGWSRTINTWFKKEQDRVRRGGGGYQTPQNYPKTPYKADMAQKKVSLSEDTKPHEPMGSDEMLASFLLRAGILLKLQEDKTAYDEYLKQAKPHAERIFKFFGYDKGIKMLMQAKRATGKQDDFKYLCDQVFKHFKDWQKGD